MATSNKGIIASLLRIVEKLDVITNWGSNGKGTYAGGTQYQKGDLVSYNGLAYVAITATIGNLPTNTTYWQQITVAGPTGATGPAGVAGAAGIVGGISFGYLFSTTTTDADPGSGLLRLNHATPASATQIYLDDNDKNAVDIQAFLRTLDDSTSTNKTRVILIKESDLTKWAIYDVTAVTEAAGYFKLTVTFVAANSTFANNDVIAISCSTVGDKGTTGAAGAAGATGASGGTIQYAADAGASDAYAITVAGPVAYNAGDQYLFKANTANTGAATLNVNAIGAITIKKNNDQDLANNDIEAGQLVLVAYNATDNVFEMLSQLANAASGGSIPYAADAGASDTYAITAGSAVAYATGDMYAFKANTVNTGAATLNVNAIGAVTLKKHKDVDLENGDIKAGQLVLVQYDGTNFQVLSRLSNDSVPSGASVYNSVSQAITTATVTLLTFNSEQFDTDSFHDTSSNTSRLTAPVAGKYVIVASIVFDVNSVGRRQFFFRKNGTDLFGSVQEVEPVTTGGYSVCKGNLLVDLAQGDYVECVVYHTKGSNLDVIGNAVGNSQTSTFQIYKVR